MGSGCYTNGMTMIEDKIYAAGFFDGEGSVQIFRSRYIKPGYRSLYYCIRVNIANTDRSVLEWTKERWGGGIISERRPHPSNWKQVYQWTVAAKTAVGYLRDLAPFVKVKKDPVSYTHLR